MARHIGFGRSRRFGSILGGLLLAELGLLQFFKMHFGIEWPEMWSLFLLVPGVALVIMGLFNRYPARDSHPDRR